MINIKSERENQINKIFSDFNKFKIKIRIVFREIDKIRMTERKIFYLQQKEATAIYTAAFQRIAVLTE